MLSPLSRFRAQTVSENNGLPSSYYIKTELGGIRGLADFSVLLRSPPTPIPLFVILFLLKDRLISRYGGIWALGIYGIF